MDDQTALVEIEAALAVDPTNVELLTARAELLEILSLSADVTKLSREAAASEPASKRSRFSETAPIESEPTEEFAHPLLQVGSRCSALFAGDGLWYEAVVNKVPNVPTEKYTVTFAGYGNDAEVEISSVRPLPVEESKHSARKSKSKPVHASSVNEEEKELVIPKSLKILPTDSDEVRVQKKKKLHAFKSQHRLKQAEHERASRASAWQQFTTAAAKKTKIGFFTGRQKDSIFKSPDSVEGRVGVTGSGSAPTAQPTFKPKDVKRERTTPLSLDPTQALDPNSIPEQFRILPDVMYHVV